MVLAHRLLGLCYGDHCLIVLECETDFFNRAMSIIEGYHTNGWLKKSSKVLLSSDTSTPQFSSYSYKLLTNSTTQVGTGTHSRIHWVVARRRSRDTHQGVPVPVPVLCRAMPPPARPPARRSPCVCARAHARTHALDTKRRAPHSSARGVLCLSKAAPSAAAVLLGEGDS